MNRNNIYTLEDRGILYAQGEDVLEYLQNIITNDINKVTDNIADKYFSSRDYDSKISAWASEQSKILQNKNELLKRIDGFKKTYSENANLPRPENWSGWILEPTMIEFWLKGPNRIHERLRYNKESNNWIKNLLNP